MSGGKMSYAAMANKNTPAAAPSLSDAYTNDLFNGKKQTSNLAAASANSAFKPNVKSNKEDDFPPINNGDSKKVPQIFKQEDETITRKPTNNNLMNGNTIHDNNNINETNNENNDGEFKEITRRSKTDRTHKNSNSNSSNWRDNNRSKGGDNKNRDGAGSGGFNRNRNSASFRNKNNSDMNVSRTSQNGDNKSFIDRLKDEEANLKLKYKEPKDKLCFNFVKGDLFSASDDTSLAHCVSEDFRMGKGIAVEFKKRFEGVNELLSQNVKTGGCAYLKQNNRHIFYLVTKKFYSHKPYYNCLENSLKAMLGLCQKFNITQLAMPLIGSGLDKLEWDLVARIIDDVFNKTNIKITIYKFEPVRTSKAGARAGANAADGDRK